MSIRTMINMKNRRARSSPFFLLWLLPALLFFGSMLVHAQENLLPNPGFEEGLDAETGLPSRWTLFSGKPEVNLRIEQEGQSGNHVLVIDDDSPTAGYGVRSLLFPAKPGDTYRATVRAKTASGGQAHLYLDYWHEGRARLQAQSVSTTRDDWTTLNATLTAPEGTQWVSVILYSLAAAQGIAYFDDVTLTKIDADQWTEEDMDVDVGEDQLDYAPVDGSTVSSNPPAFVWVPVGGARSYSLEYSTSPIFAHDETIRVDGIELSVYTPPHILDDQQTWYWRVFAVDGEGKESPPSTVRAFTISPTAVHTPLPDLATVRSRIPAGHPRLFVTPDGVEEMRSARRSNMLLRVLADGIIRSARTLVFTPLPEEPPHARPGGVWDVNLWREYRITVRATEDMATLAFAYLLTGDTAFGEAARDLMLHIVSWDPYGATSAAVNDESSMPILYQVSRAYTWIYDILTPEERQKVQDVMRIRGNEAYQILKRRPFESRPYGSHAGRSLGFLGEAGIAFLGEIPEAEEWFDYIVKIFYSVYPAWGKDPGGWAEGHAYWNSYMNRVLWFVDALNVATGLDLYEKAFFKNTGMFKLYTHPPYSQMGPFGDFADRGPTSSDGNVMSHFAGVYDNPYYKWYADQVGAVAETGVMGFLRAYYYPRAHIKGQAPTDLPNSAYFPDVGWVVFHKEFGNPRDSIQFMFKSSPYGSFSHSLADQNTFTLEAYGEPLAISSGYRPWYGSDHHMRWTKTTQAHNGLLIGGNGQITQSLEAKGEITGFLNGNSFDYTAGDAAQAYGRLVDKYLRHVVYLRPDVFVVYDDVQTPTPETFSWLLHSYHSFDIAEEQPIIRTVATSASLDVHLWASDTLTIEQTDEFAVPLDEPMNKPTQWHLTATTERADAQAQFLAVLVPKKTGSDRALQVNRLDIPMGEGVAIHDEQATSVVLFANQSGTQSAEGLTFEGSVAAWTRSDENREGVLLVEGTHWHAESGLSVQSSVPLDVEMTFEYERDDNHSHVRATGTIVAPAGPGSQPFQFTVKLPPATQVESVTSSHEVLDMDYDQTQGILMVTLAPGTHQITIE